MPVPPDLPELDLRGWFAEELAGCEPGQVFARHQHAIAFARKLLSGDSACDAVGYEVRND